MKRNSIWSILNALLVTSMLLVSCQSATPAATTEPTSAQMANTTIAATTAQQVTATTAQQVTATTAQQVTATTEPTKGSEPLPAANIKVMSFTVAPEEVGSPFGKATLKFLTDFQAANPNVKVDSLEAPPDFDNQILVDLAAGTAPDVWGADASTLARLIDSNNVLDMRKCVEVDPSFNMDRFFPALLDITKRADGSIYGVPNNGTPMVVFYNPETFKKYNVAEPQSGWTWDDLLKTAQALTTDKNGNHPTDASFDVNNVVTWGYRVRKYTMEWIYRVWENGGDVISPDGTTASGYLDSAATREALQFNKDMVLKYHVSPPPSVLDQMVQSLVFPDLMLTGNVAMYERGHWELVGIFASKNFNGNNFAVAPEPVKQNGKTVAYYSVFVINNAVAKDPAKLKAACAFVDAATLPGYQDTFAISGIAIAANQASAQKAAAAAKYPQSEAVFISALDKSIPPYGSKYAKWPAIETILDGMMEKILAGGDVTTETSAAVVEINRELSQK